MAHGTAASRSLNANLARLLSDLAELRVATYAARADEVETKLKSRWAAFYPRVRGRDLEFYRHLGVAPMRTSKIGVREPLAKAELRLRAEDSAVICCPAVATDWSGQRLGLGQGFYDRFFNRHPHLIRVGVVFQVQVSSDPLPADRGDEPLDWIVTDQMILRLHPRRTNPWT